jgi:hypothetical protein
MLNCFPSFGYCLLDTKPITNHKTLKESNQSDHLTQINLLGFWGIFVLTILYVLIFYYKNSTFSPYLKERK